VRFSSGSWDCSRCPRSCSWLRSQAIDGNRCMAKRSTTTTTNAVRICAQMAVIGKEAAMNAREQIAEVVWVSQTSIEAPIKVTDRIIAIVREALLSKSAITLADDIEYEIAAERGMYEMTLPTVIDRVLGSDR